MAEFFKPPSHLDITDGNVSENYRKWKRQMEVYMAASGATGKEKKIQTSIILHCAGPHVIEIYDQFEWVNADDKHDPEKVFEKIESYCNPRKNEVLETHRFWTTNMENHTSFESFLTELRKRIESCNFNENDRMIRDKIVFSASGKLQELLLREEHLELTKCIQICRAYEQSNKHVNEIRGKELPGVHKVATYAQSGASGEARPKTPSNMSKPRLKTCDFCNYRHEFGREKCPAWGKVCDSCGGRNHFKVKCKKVHNVEVADDDSDDSWLNAVNNANKPKNRVNAKMVINNCEIDFQLDSAADVNTITQKFVKKEQVKSTCINLRMWNKSAMKPLGAATLTMKNPQTGEEHDVDFVIVPNKLECLLGLKTIQELNLVTFNHEKFISKITSDLGDLGEVHLHIDTNANPKALPSRKIPIAIKDDVKKEIDSLVERGILQEVTEPTKWVSQMAVVRKASGGLRICIDPQPLNQALMREHYKLPVFDDILPELHDAKVFTKLDVKEAFWHVKLDTPSSLLTTMITPFGRYRWLRLPFGLNVSSEIFQRKLNEALSGLNGTFTIADDIIVVGCGNDVATAKRDNNLKLQKLNQRCNERNIVLNEKKKEQGYEISFHGHNITADGIKPDEAKIKAVIEMSPPKDVTEVKRLCGVVQYMAKFLPDLSNTLEPLRKLTRKNEPWNWTQACEIAFTKVKKMLTEAPVLVYFNPNKELVLQVDSSKDGLGAVLLQEGKPIEFASRSLKPAERKWAQIEKEALAVLYGLERFDQYTYGRKVIIQNDHKPLETILRKPLSQAPKRLQDIIMKLFRYDIEFQFMKGVDLVIADTLSRAYNETDESEMSRTRILEINVFENIPDKRIQEIRDATANDANLQMLIKVILQGWPQHKDQVNPEVRKYFALRDTLSHKDGIILKGEAILIPKTLRTSIMNRLHSAHMSYDSMIRRARGTVFWLGMSDDIKCLAEACEPCMEMKPSNQREPLNQHADGNYQWEKIGLDLMEIQNRHYLVAVDYYSNFIEIDLLTSTTTQQVVTKLKKQFARFGIPSRIVSDGGPQFTSNEFEQFKIRWGISHHITSPHHPKSNGKAEAAVKIMKHLMIKCVKSGDDQYEALLEQRNTPRQDTGKSPAEMMFGCGTRTMLPKLRPKSNVNEKRESRKRCVKQSYDKKSRNLPRLKNGQSVYFKHKMDKPWIPGKLIEQSGRNTSVTSGEGVQYQRNRVHVKPTTIPVNIRDISPPRSMDPPSRNCGENQPDPTTSQEKSAAQNEAKQSIPDRTERPKRETNTPAYLKDYVRY